MNITVSDDVQAGLKEFYNSSCEDCVNLHPEWTFADAYIRTLVKYPYLVYEKGRFISRFYHEVCIERQCFICGKKNGLYLTLKKSGWKNKYDL